MTINSVTDVQVYIEASYFCLIVWLGRTRSNNTLLEDVYIIILSQYNIEVSSLCKLYVLAIVLQMQAVAGIIIIVQ